ncbi:FAD/NAD(P)-binding protein [Sphingomonas sp. BN140010]|uniref:FAD/NAD(P)-binding protein n=1 Tax=Sphingomonas arvum TaxID=2992113 RepID=A0ABT3JCN2_9SPHN|nr:FAD/NAD(P)-binding protein [Sphingomonas sp. BN140010]MCW3796830.1 FAD/NAD(P)-binding protein [Sphingomonas sp. BN140010]
MRSDEAGRVPVAIIGGGFSGTMTALHLARRGVRSVVIDGSGRAGRGVAYATTDPAHLLNVPAAKMSAWPDQPDHFVHWSGLGGGEFAERRAFGRYLSDQLAASEVKVAEAIATGAERTADGWRVSLDDGRQVSAQGLVLAQGNQPPAPLPVAERLPHELYIANPWSEAAREAIERAAERDSDVLIIGTGLTMVDTVLSLAEAGHSGRITALSRRGLVPRAHAHAAAPPAPVELGELPLGSVRKLARWLRRRSAEVGFRPAVDALRPHSHAIWQSFNGVEEQRFIRHARPWWDIHRHRLAPQVAEQLKSLIADGRLQVMAGRLVSLGADDGEVQALIRRRRGSEVERRFGLAVNCTGPLGEIAQTRDALLAGLLARGEVRADRFGIGLEVDERDRAGERLWALGPLTKGRYWEITAVPDIRGQAAAAAEDIAAEIGAR